MCALQKAQRYLIFFWKFEKLHIMLNSFQWKVSILYHVGRKGGKGSVIYNKQTNIKQTNKEIEKNEQTNKEDDKKICILLFPKDPLAMFCPSP